MARPFAPYANTNRQNQDIYENAVNRHFKAAHVPTVSPSCQERQETMAFKKKMLTKQFIRRTAGTTTVATLKTTTTRTTSATAAAPATASASATATTALLLPLLLLLIRFCLCCYGCGYCYCDCCCCTATGMVFGQGSWFCFKPDAPLCNTRKIPPQARKVSFQLRREGDCCLFPCRGRLPRGGRERFM